MGYQLTGSSMESLLAKLREEYLVYAPVRMEGGNTFSDVDCVRYGQIDNMGQIVWDRKSEYSFKEILLPLSQVLFYYTEEQVKVADPPKKGAVVFVRSCDLHAVKRLDEIYLRNGPEDHYYRRVRDKVKFVLMGCERAFDSCFCVDMGTNRSDGYDLYLHPQGEGYLLDNRVEAWEALLAERGSYVAVSPSFVEETETRVAIPDNLTADVAKSGMWDEYDGRCIDCGRCNFACPTCTCYTMQDICYTDNGRAGERRRVHASCMVNGFTDMAGGHAYRQKNGQRMRFKVLHKVYDYGKRFGYHMCVGCGRCDDICPEYISFSGCVNRLDGAMKEVLDNAKK